MCKPSKRLQVKIQFFNKILYQCHQTRAMEQLFAIVVILLEHKSIALPFGTLSAPMMQYPGDSFPSNTGAFTNQFRQQMPPSFGIGYQNQVQNIMPTSFLPPLGGMYPNRQFLQTQIPLSKQLPWPTGQISQPDNNIQIPSPNYYQAGCPANQIQPPLFGTPGANQVSRQFYSNAGPMSSWNNAPISPPFGQSKLPGSSYFGRPNLQPSQTFQQQLPFPTQWAYQTSGFPTTFPPHNNFLPSRQHQLPFYGSPVVPFQQSIQTQPNTRPFYPQNFMMQPHQLPAFSTPQPVFQPTSPFQSVAQRIPTGPFPLQSSFPTNFRPIDNQPVPFPSSNMFNGLGLNLAGPRIPFPQQQGHFPFRYPPTQQPFYPPREPQQHPFISASQQAPRPFIQQTQKPFNYLSSQSPQMSFYPRHLNQPQTPLVASFNQQTLDSFQNIEGTLSNFGNNKEQQVFPGKENQLGQEIPISSLGTQSQSPSTQLFMPGPEIPYQQQLNSQNQIAPQIPTIVENPINPGKFSSPLFYVETQARETSNQANELPSNTIIQESVEPTIQILKEQLQQVVDHQQMPKTQHENTNHVLHAERNKIGRGKVTHLNEKSKVHNIPSYEQGGGDAPPHPDVSNPKINTAPSEQLMEPALTSIGSRVDSASRNIHLHHPMRKTLPHHHGDSPYYSQSQIDAHHKRTLEHNVTPEDADFEKETSVLSWYERKLDEEIRKRKTSHKNHSHT